MLTDPGKSDDAEAYEKNRLQHVDPDGSAHAAEKDSRHDDEGNDRAAEGIGNSPIGQRVEDRPAAGDADDQIRYQHSGGDKEDERADEGALVAIAEETHLRDQAKAFADCPESRADEEEGEGNDQRAGGGHH